MAPKIPLPRARMHWTRFLRGRPKQRGVMNKLETAYAAILDTQMAAGEVLWYVYESVKLKIAKGAYYTPDFAVQLADGTLQLIEVKGFWAEAARLRIKVAADRFPFQFLAVTKRTKREGGGWKYERFKECGGAEGKKEQSNNVS